MKVSANAKGNPYHDERGRFCSANTCSTYTHTESESASAEVAIQEEKRAANRAYNRFKKAHAKELKNGAKTIVYSNGKGEYRFGIYNTAEIAEHTEEHGGMSYDINTGKQPTDGYMVATSSKYSATYDSKMSPAKQEAFIRSYIKKHKEKLTESNMHMGTWVDEKGIVWLDISERVESKHEAVRKGKERNQIAVWDVKNCDEVNTGGDGS